MSEFGEWPEDPGFLPDQREMCALVARGWPFGLRSTDRGSILIQVGDPDREVVCVPAEIGGKHGPAMVLLAFSYGAVQAILDAAPSPAPTGQPQREDAP